MQIVQTIAIVLLAVIVFGVARYMWVIWHGRATGYSTWVQLSKWDWWTANITAMAQLAWVVLIIVLAIMHS